MSRSSQRPKEVSSRKAWRCRGRKVLGDSCLGSARGRSLPQTPAVVSRAISIRSLAAFPNVNMYVIGLTPSAVLPLLCSCPSSSSQFNHPDRNSVEDPRPANSGLRRLGLHGLCRRAISPATRGFDFRDVDFPHFHHRFKGALGLRTARGHRAVRARGVICQDNPQRSLHQPQALSWPPLPTIAFQ